MSPCQKAVEEEVCLRSRPRVLEEDDTSDDDDVDVDHSSDGEKSLIASLSVGLCSIFSRVV